ncbi:MAG: PAS domain S-box protein [Longimicrobiales bacterium]|nr:PAS domain S-box protein [Longimicrobiales bacterium]
MTSDSRSVFRHALPVVAGVVVLLVSVLLWKELNESEGDQIRRAVESAAEGVGGEIAARLEARLLALDRMGSRWEEGGAPTQREWTADAELYLRHGVANRGIAWADADSRLRWIVPPEPADTLVGGRLGGVERIRPSLEEARETGRPTITPALGFYPDRPSFLALAPIHGIEGFQGYIVGFSTTRDLLQEMLAQVEPQFGVAVHQGSSTLYRRGEEPTEARLEWIHQDTVDLFGTSWRVEVWPTPGFLAIARSDLPEVVLVVGILLALLLTLTLLLARRASEEADAAVAMAQKAERAREELSRKEQRFRTLVTATTQMVWWTDPDGRIDGPLHSWQEFTGQSEEEIQGLGWTDAVHPDDVDRVLEAWNAAVRDRSVYDIEYRVRRADGAYREFAVRGVPVTDEDGAILEWIGTCTDITERKEAERARAESEARLLQAQKMESIGQLAGGIAHDFNNLLTVVLGECEIALNAVGEDDPLESSLTHIRSAGQRASMLTRQLLTFSRRQPVDPVVFDLNEVVRDMESMLTRVIGEKIRLETRVGADPVPVRADRGQVEQVLVNLVVNARDAMPDGGTVRIETATARLDDHHPQVPVEVPPGEYVLLAVTDTGVGMTDDVMDHVFEPFFTTKEMGKGTGLGLATCYGIAQQAGGFMEAESEPGEGTTMKLYLPTAEEPPSSDGSSENGRMPRGAERVLLVEDDENVRRVSQRMLERLGYDVVTARDAEEALSMPEGRIESLDLLLTDVVLPGMGGRVLAETIRERHPGIEILFASGYSDDEILDREILKHGGRLVQKPFTVDQLARKVREALDSREASDPTSRKAPSSQ